MKQTSKTFTDQFRDDQLRNISQKPKRAFTLAKGWHEKSRKEVLFFTTDQNRWLVDYIIYHKKSGRVVHQSFIIRKDIDLCLVGLRRKGYQTIMRNRLPYQESRVKVAVTG